MICAAYDLNLFPWQRQSKVIVDDDGNSKLASRYLCHGSARFVIWRNYDVRLLVHFGNLLFEPFEENWRFQECCDVHVKGVMPFIIRVITMHSKQALYALIPFDKVAALPEVLCSQGNLIFMS